MNILYTAKKGFSIVLAMGLTLLLSFTGLYLLEYMIPFSRNIRDVENASQAFYQSYSGIENALYTVSQNTIGYGTSVVSSDFEYTLTGTGTDIPMSGLGNSSYNKDWNRISQTEPIQLIIGKGRLNSGGANRITLSLRVPESQNLKTTDGVDDIILWQLNSSISSLSSRSGSLLHENDINADIVDMTFWNTGKLSQGVALDGVNITFNSFYGTDCNDSTEECVLKILVIHPLISTDNNIIPYLEYQIKTANNAPIPLRYAQIESDGKTYGFTKKLKVAVPQQTTNSAFDFTIFQ